jgi:hypothetical protein
MISSRDLESYDQGTTWSHHKTNGHVFLRLFSGFFWFAALFLHAVGHTRQGRTTVPMVSREKGGVRCAAVGVQWKRPPSRTRVTESIDSDTLWPPTPSSSTTIPAAPAVRSGGGWRYAPNHNSKSIYRRRQFRRRRRLYCVFLVWSDIWDRHSSNFFDNDQFDDHGAVERTLTDYQVKDSISEIVDGGNGCQSSSPRKRQCVASQVHGQTPNPSLKCNVLLDFCCEVAGQAAAAAKPAAAAMSNVD